MACSYKEVEGRTTVFPSSVAGFMEEGLRDRKNEKWRETHI